MENKATKELLLQALSVRLTYGVKVTWLIERGLAIEVTPDNNPYE